MTGVRGTGWPWLGVHEPHPTLAAYRPVIGGQGMVSSPHAAASAIGLDVLRAGGNAVDAAVATSAALAVTCPMQCGPGGDAFWLVAAPDGRVSALDASGRSSRHADAEVLRRDGQGVIPPRSGRSVTVPGAVSGWVEALRSFGTRPLGDLVEPAAALAEAGIFTSRHIRASFLAAEPDLLARDALRLWSGDGRSPALYARIRQGELAASLRAIGRSDGRSLYEGPLAGAIARAVRAAGGWVDEEDLAAHRPQWIEPLQATFRDVVVQTTPPSTQGFALLAALACLEAVAPSRLPDREGGTVHLLVEAVMAALAERDRRNCDRDLFTGALDLSWTETVARRFRDGFDPARRSEPEAGVARGATKGDTAHLAVVDRDGMAVSLIQSLFFDFGACIPVPEGGFTLQNRGASFHLDRGRAGELLPFVRPPSTLMPTIVSRGGAPVMAMGCMGGDGQVQTQLQLLVDIFDGDLDPQQAVSRARWYVDRSVPGDPAVFVEAGVSPGVIEALRARGHRVEVLGSCEEVMGHAQVIRRQPGGALVGAADPRSDGQVAAF